MSNIIRFPVERSAGCKRDTLMRELEDLLRHWRVNKAIEHLDQVAELARLTRPRAADFRRDRIGPPR